MKLDWCRPGSRPGHPDFRTVQQAPPSTVNVMNLKHCPATQCPAPCIFSCQGVIHARAARNASCALNY